MGEVIRVLVVDDHAVVRQGLRTFLELQEDIEVVGEAGDGASAAALAADLEPDVVLMDLQMPGSGGVEGIRLMKEAGLAARVIVLTSFTDDGKVLPAIRAGAAGYLLKDVDPQALAQGIRSVHSGQVLLNADIAARLLTSPAPASAGRAETLTERERDVLREIARGQSNREIARALVVSEKTVKTHVSSILAKLGLQDRTQAALYAVQHDLAD
jgi:DNA-binding NarL/FixJ family response regulator